jgi:hypothetical protein
MLPNFLLIGPGRAGSDWITKNLSLHPDIYMPPRKVTRFFSGQYNKGIVWYSNIFGDRKEKAVGEASVGYLRNEAAPARIARHIPDIKLIANLRASRQDAASAVLPASRAPAMQVIGFPSRQDKDAPRLLEAGFWTSSSAMVRPLSKGRLIMTFDDMKADRRVLRTIYEFLDVDPRSCRR